MSSIHRQALPIVLALASCATPGAPAGGPASSAGALAAVEDASAAALQADARRALKSIRAVPPTEFHGPEAAFRDCMLGRLGGGPPSPPAEGGDAFADRLLAAFRAYWWRSITHPEERAVEEARLLGALQALLGPGAGGTLDELDGPIAERLRREGWHALLGLTPPLRELMLWSRENVERRRVALPDGTDQSVRMVVLGGFRSLGWADWATCGRHGAGGWADADALYVVRPRYRSLDDERFQVSFLGHETQHLSDRRSLPGLDAWELEYRAKLTELALAQDTRRDLLESFARNQGGDPAVPHSYADHRVLADLRARLGLGADADLAAVPGPALREAARETLREDSRRHAGQPHAG